MHEEGRNSQARENKARVTCQYCLTHLNGWKAFNTQSMYCITSLCHVISNVYETRENDNKHALREMNEDLSK
jgi:hypothetical protein